MKPSLVVHKFTSCDGCQLALLNMGEELLALAERVDIIHFTEAGFINDEALADIALIEGSISTATERARIKKIRQQSKYLVTIGACANSGGLQALRNEKNTQDWVRQIYATPEHIDCLETSSPISDHVRVDFRIWGCPVNERQVVAVLSAVLLGVSPTHETEPVCLECKRQNSICVLVSKGEACLGPVTRSGCGALCPRLARGCYGCNGPADNANTDALVQRFRELGITTESIQRHFQFINSNAPAVSAVIASLGKERAEQ